MQLGLTRNKQYFNKINYYYLSSSWRNKISYNFYQQNNSISSLQDNNNNNNNNNFSLFFRSFITTTNSKNIISTPILFKESLPSFSPSPSIIKKKENTTTTTTTNNNNNLISENILLNDIYQETEEETHFFEETLKNEIPSYDTLIQAINRLRFKGVLAEGRAKALKQFLLLIQSKEKAIDTTRQDLLTQGSEQQQEFVKQFGELQFEDTDQMFLQNVGIQLLSLRNHAKRVAMSNAPALDVKVRAVKKKKAHTQKEAGENAISFSPGEWLGPGDSLPLDEETVKTYFPEGIAGWLESTQVKSLKDSSTILRETTCNLVHKLEERKNNGFLNSESKNESIILSGSKGSGKSVILNQLVYWARKNGWFVCWIPDGEKWVGGGELTPSRIENGLWDQRETAMDFAEKMILAHGPQLKQLRIKGAHHIHKFEYTPDSSTLYDLLAFAIGNEKRAVDAIVAFRSELCRITEFPVLIAIDKYNVLYHIGNYYDPDDVAAGRGNVRRIPAQKLTLSKIFSDHEDHGLVNGTVISALSETLTTRPFLKECGTKYLQEVAKLSQLEYTNLLEYYKEKQWISPESTNMATAKYIYHIAQGNPKEIFTYCGASF